MITDMVHGPIVQTHLRHVVFAVDAEGTSSIGFAQEVSAFWPELAERGQKKLGEVLTKQVGPHTFHALVCYSNQESGWKQTPEIVTQCLDSLDVADDEPIAVTFIGAGPTGQQGGADTFAILGVIARSKRDAVIYSL